MAKRGGFPGGGMPGNMANLMGAGTGRQCFKRNGRGHKFSAAKGGKCRVLGLQ